MGIIYKTIYVSEYTDKEISYFLKNSPVQLIKKYLIEYIIPIKNHNRNLPWMYHRADGPALVYPFNLKSNQYFYYGIRSTYKEEFWDPNFRKMAEIKTFI